MRREEISLKDETFISLRDFICEKSGIYFSLKKKYLLENRLKNRVLECNCGSFEDYYYFLKYDKNKNLEMKRLFDSITTNETSFFRNLPQLVAFEKSILPQVMEVKGEKKKKCIRIWSAGCSTGEEPFTIAMILLEHQLRSKGWEIEIIANDISEGALSSAKYGLYKKNKINSIPERYLYEYFDNTGEEYSLKIGVKDLVKFKNTNLIDQIQNKTYQDFDIVFCRNVLIYFDNEAKKKVITTIYDLLNPGGYLFIGHSESLHNLSRAFKPLHFEKAIVYKKE